MAGKMAGKMDGNAVVEVVGLSVALARFALGLTVVGGATIGGAPTGVAARLRALDTSLLSTTWALHGGSVATVAEGSVVLTGGATGGVRLCAEAGTATAAPASTSAAASPASRATFRLGLDRRIRQPPLVERPWPRVQGRVMQRNKNGSASSRSTRTGAAWIVCPHHLPKDFHAQGIS